jgi:hypothetical protein
LIENLSSLVLTVVSAALLGYWFRYACLLILCTRTPRNYACDVAAVHRLNFLSIQRQLHEGGAASLDILQASLNRDYRLLKHLIRQRRRENSTRPLGYHLLRIDFQLMVCWHSLTRRFSARAARWAVKEMSSVVAYLANSIGEGALVST